MEEIMRTAEGERLVAIYRKAAGIEIEDCAAEHEAAESAAKPEAAESTVESRGKKLSKKALKKQKKAAKKEAAAAKKAAKKEAAAAKKAEKKAAKKAEKEAKAAAQQAVLEAKLADPYSKEFFEARKAEMSERVHGRRMEHILGVAQTAKKIAKEYGVDAKKAKLAGLLHDWDKCYDDEGIRVRAAEVGLEVEQEVLDNMPATLHGMTAAMALAKEYPVIPADVLQAVSRHTTAAVGMDDLDMVVFIADCLEPSRNFEQCDELRSLVGIIPLEELFFQVHSYWLQLIVDRGRTMHPCTIDVYNHYALKHKQFMEQLRAAAGLEPHVIDPCAVSE